MEVAKTMGTTRIGGELGIQSRGSETQAEAGSSATKSFGDVLSTAIDRVDALQKQADVATEKLATGQSQNLHETMIAAEKADIALRLMIQVRNKIIDAYQEVMKMQV